MILMIILNLSKAISGTSDYSQQAGDNEAILPPKSILIPGAPESHPRNNVDRSDVPRTKSKYHCSICGSSEHTAPRFPTLPNNKQTLFA